jgi:GNAT superfamily N-acetyltransferase
MGMEIKRIAVDESGLVAPLFDLYRQFYHQAPDIKLAEWFIGERLNHEESVIFVAMANQITIGFTQLFAKYSSIRASKNWILNDLYVREGYRKKGIGRGLLTTAIQFAKHEGATFLELETAVDNYAAQHLYETTGFTRQEPDADFLVYRITV